MSVILILYLCADATRTNCQVVRAESWNGPHAYERCVDVALGLTQEMTAPNRDRHRFVCEILGEEAKPAEHKAQPAFIHQSFRM